MSFQIFVIIPQAAIPMPSNSHTWEKWARESSKVILFEETLGSDATVYTYWSSLAEQLGLPLLASVYTRGLHLDAIQDFHTLATELDILESYWQVHLLDEQAGQDAEAIDLLETLKGRLSHFRRAIQLASEKRAILFVEQPP